MIEIIPNWHPVMVHFTVALFSLSVALFLLTLLMGESELTSNWRVIARWSLWIGMGMTTLTVASGLYAYNTVAHDTPSHAAMTLHRDWALTTVGLFSLLTVWSLFKHRGGAKASLPFVVLMMVAGGVMASTAWLGGEAVYRYGLGVMSLPQSDAHGHGISSIERDRRMGDSTMDLNVPVYPEEVAHDANLLLDRSHDAKTILPEVKPSVKNGGHLDDGHAH